MDNFARFTLGVALFVIVVGSFMRQNAAGGVLDTVGFILIIIHISESFPEISLHDMRKTRNIWDILRKIRSWFTREKKYDGAEKKHIISIPARVVDRKIRIPRGKGQKVEIECPKCHEKFIKRR